MPAWYPNYPDDWNWTDVVDHVDDVEADHINQLYAEAFAIGTGVRAHMSKEMPHQFVDGGTVYMYGFKQEDGHMVFMYEEVV